mmetsp:Transcript_97166/g.245055  ORF Transcript_97166/g.245055 Transcript_97166/m.245055 type:complete len:865 (-) Transcript_97166:164-2758(-)
MTSATAFAAAASHGVAATHSRSHQLGLATAAPRPHHRPPLAASQQRLAQTLSHWLAVAAAVPLVAGATHVAGRRRARRRLAALLSRGVLRRVSTLERSTLEAGAKLLEEAVQASQERGNPTRFNYQSLEKNRQSYVSQQAAEQGDEDPNAVDGDGLPLVYSVERIARFWDTQPGELAQRWSFFLGISTPFITQFFYSLLNNRLWEDEADLARKAVDNLTQLGPTFVKLGQVLSIRPDVLPPVTMRELARLQDNIKPFSTDEARQTVEKELGKPIDELFSFFSSEPIAAASLAQVYRATLRETGEEVAVKVQRPGALGTISKDLYVLRRLADVTQPLIRRFTSDETDYIALTETFAEGLYTELDFRNEALNALRMEELLKENATAEAMDRLVIPTPLMSLTTRRVMLSKWVNGVKLSTLPQAEIQELISIGQELFLTQLLDIGFFHGDPHPGNLLKITEGPDEGKLCLLDFGLVAQVPRSDRDTIVASVVHLGTQNWDALIDDFVALGFLAEDTDKGVLIPILQRVLEPYLKGGGAQSMKNANFQALTQDLLKINLDVRFSIPPYVSLLARSVATLEGIALQGDPGYQIVSQAYPFVVRKLLTNDNRQSFTALRELLYDPKTQRLRPQRLSTMLQASLGVVAEKDKASGFIDFDTVPEDGAPLSEVIRFLLSDRASNLRPLLNAELAYGVDLTLRRAGRRLRSEVRDLLSPRVPLLGFRLPPPPLPPLLVPLPSGAQGDGAAATPRLKLMMPDDLLDAVLPPLSTNDDVDLDTFSEAVRGALLGDAGEALLQPSPELLQATASALVSTSGGSNGNAAQRALAELTSALRVALSGPQSRAALTDEVLAEVAREILRTWQARLTMAA